MESFFFFFVKQRISRSKERTYLIALYAPISFGWNKGYLEENEKIPYDQISY